MHSVPPKRLLHRAPSGAAARTAVRTAVRAATALAAFAILLAPAARPAAAATTPAARAATGATHTHKAAAHKKPAAAAPAPSPAGAVYPVQEGFVDAHGVLIYYTTVGRGAPLVIVHGGPGATHGYFLPHLLPLARQNRLIFIDERGSGRSEKLDDVKQYTVEAMADDVEEVRRALNLGKINLLGHSYGGVVAQAYAFKHQANLSHLLLCSTFHSTRALNDVFVKMKAAMPPELRARIDAMEKVGLYGHGSDYEKNRYTDDYMKAAWGEGYFPYLYQRHPDPNYNPTDTSSTSWDLYREMWGSHGEFVIDGNLVSVEYADRLPSIKVPTLITAGDHDESDPSIARTMQALIPGSKLVIYPQSGHMTFVDQPVLFIQSVEEFLHPAPARKAG